MSGDRVLQESSSPPNTLIQLHNPFPINSTQQLPPPKDTGNPTNKRRRRRNPTKEAAWIWYSRNPNDLSLFRRRGIAAKLELLQKQPVTKVNHIHYVNMDTNPQRREFMEGWLRQQSIPYSRHQGQPGEPNICTKQRNLNDRQCIGISGLARTMIGLLKEKEEDSRMGTKNIDNSTVTMTTTTTTEGQQLQQHQQEEQEVLTLVLEDDISITPANMTRLLKSISMVPKDWDIIRWDCHGEIPRSFPWINDYVFRASYQYLQQHHNNNNNDTYTCQESRGHPCWFCGGTHTMLWRESSIPKLQTAWDQRPYHDIDCRLVKANIDLVGYCVQLNVVQLYHPEGEASNIPIHG
jgi:hypothetical protein